MAAAKEIRTKIRSIKNTQKITRAMEMVAASKMRRVQERMRRAKPYAAKILEVIARVANSHPEYPHPYLKARDVKRVGLIVVTTDRGLCGGLNTNLLRTVIAEVKRYKEEGKEVSLCLIGSKAESFFKRIGGHVIGHVNHLGDAPQLSDFIGVIKIMLDAYKENHIDALFLCSNQFVNTMQQVPHMQQVLPLLPSKEQQLQHYWDYIYEPDDARNLLENLLKRYIESQVYRGVIENIACEQAARMLAMKNATENAAEFINDLELAYHKARQAAITRELSEIVAGAAVV